MLASAALMSRTPLAGRSDVPDGFFRRRTRRDGPAAVSRLGLDPAAIPCPATGRPLRVATVDTAAAAICPSCAHRGAGAFVSFVGDLRMAYACPQCCQFIWLAGA
jgi:hypothetical protein